MDILIVEDNLDLSANLAEFLEQQGHTIDAAVDGRNGYQLACDNKYDVILLDLMLPGMDGLEICLKLREEARDDTPILMLTARDTIDDKLRGFASGSDDYLVKPFSLHELHARIVALDTRHKRRAVKQILQVDDLVLDETALHIQRADTKIVLTPIELQILTLLMRHTPEVVKREELEREIWGDLPPDSDALRSHIHSLRNAIDKPFDTALLQTVRGVGYKIVSSHGL